MESMGEEDMEYKSLLATVFGYSPKMRILDYLLDFPTNDFTKKEIIDALGMSKQTFYKYFDDLQEVGIVKVNRTIGKAKLYKIDSANKMVKMIVDFERKMSMQIADKEKEKLKKPIAAK
jgi:predicted transcriptional regulator